MQPTSWARASVIAVDTHDSAGPAKPEARTGREGTAFKAPGGYEGKPRLQSARTSGTHSVLFCFEVAQGSRQPTG